jgi:hypothetical protein
LNTFLVALKIPPDDSGKPISGECPDDPYQGLAEAVLVQGGSPAPPSPYRTRRNPLEQSLVNSRKLERLDAVVGKSFHDNSSSGDRCLVPLEETLLL